MRAVVFVLVAGLLAVSGELSEGNECTSKDGTQGTCTSVADCPGMMELMTRGSMPKICSVSNQEVIVCCSVSIAVTQTTTTPQPTTSGIHILEAYFNTKAGRMCREYSKYVYWEVYPVTLSVNAKSYNETICAMTGQKLIVGGKPAEPMEFPHMAALGYGNEDNIQWKCGGSLISKRYVLTAAHCMTSESSGDVKWVRLGDLNLANSYDDATPVTMTVEERISHPLFKPPALYHDIALLKLQADVTCTKYIRPACLYTSPGNPPNVPNVTATGWGKILYSNIVGSDDLLKVDLAIREPSKCNQTFQSHITIGSRLTQGITPDTMICAGDPLGQKDTCGGDSGGPLQVRLTVPYCMYSVIGLTSFGVEGCGVGDNPAIYTRVSFYRPWIENVVWPDN